MIQKQFFLFLFAFYVILGNWKGYIALFDPNQTEPKQIFPMQIMALPEADQLALQNGIVVRNDRDLQQLLEDYLS